MPEWKNLSCGVNLQTSARTTLLQTMTATYEAFPFGTPQLQTTSWGQTDAPIGFFYLGQRVPHVPSWGIHGILGMEHEHRSDKGSPRRNTAVGTKTYRAVSSSAATAVVIWLLNAASKGSLLLRLSFAGEIVLRPMPNASPLGG